MYVCMHVHVCVRMVGSKGYVAFYLTSDSLVRPVPPVLSIGWDHALILVEVGEGSKYVCVYTCTRCECKDGWIGGLPRLLPYV